MSRPFVICSDTGADIPWRSAQQQRLEIAHLHYTLNNESYTYDFGRDTDTTAFYYAMRQGAEVGTIPVLPEALCALFMPHLEKGEDILYICVSKALSNTFLSAKQAREEMMMKYKNQRIVIIDSRSVSVAQGMLVHEAANMRLEGSSLDETAGWLVENRMYIHSLAWIPKREYLKKLKLPVKAYSKTPALFRLTEEGSVALYEKKKTTEEGIDSIVSYIENNGFALKEQVVALFHTDALDLANELKEKIQEQTGCEQIAIFPAGPITGCYLGPDAVGVAFFGNRR